MNVSGVILVPLEPKRQRSKIKNNAWSQVTWTGAARNRQVLMTFLLFPPASTRWLGWRKDRKSRRDRLGRFWTFIVQSYFDTLLRYVLSVTFCGAVVLKVMDQKTIVKRRWSYKVRTTVYTAISRKVVGRNVHATIPKGNMGYAQYTVPDFVAVEPTFVAFLYHSQTYVHGLSCHSINFLWRTVNSKPPTIPFGIVVRTFSDNLSRNSCI